MGTGRTNRWKESRKGNGSRGKLGRRNLAMLLIFLGALTAAVLPGPRSAAAGFRSGAVPLHRLEAVAGASVMQRPAAPVPSRSSGALRVRLVEAGD